jgi:hypothetical protein
VFGVWGWGCTVQDSGLRDRGQGTEFGVQGPGSRVQGPGFRVQGSGFRVQGFRVQDSGLWVQGAGVKVISTCSCKIMQVQIPLKRLLVTSCPDIRA